MQKNKGFSLIELMVCMCLMGILISIVIAQVSLFNGISIRLEVDKLMSACLYMQQKAIATNQEQYLIFNEQKHSYRFGNYQEKLPSQVKFGFLPDAKGPPGSPSSRIKKAITFSSSRICFYPTGIISSGTVYLITSNKCMLYALSNAVSQISFLRSYVYDGVWKVYDQAMNNDKKN